MQLDRIDWERPEIPMEHRVENPQEKLLHGRTEGCGALLCGCPDDVAAALAARFGADAFGRARVFEPCRVEHPHSAYLRKPVEGRGGPALQTTLYAPDGRLTEERTADGEVTERFVKKPADFETLRGHLRDVELHPARPQPAAEGIVGIALLGLTPVRDMETRWAGLDLTAWALTQQDESAASCMRKLERQLHRRCEEACRAGCRAGVLRDMAAEPLPETYMLHAGRHIEWTRHAGLMPYVEVANPGLPLLAALCAARAGARVALGNRALYEDSFSPPEGMRFLFDVPAKDGLKGHWPQEVRELIRKCAGALVLVDCAGASESDIAGFLELFPELIQK